MNVQTGSKSKNVYVKNLAASPVSVAQQREEMKVSVAELCGKFGEVRQDGCKKCARLKSVQCGDCVKKLKYWGDMSEECEVRTRHVRWKNQTFLTQIEGGIRGELFNHNKKGSTEVQFQFQEGKSNMKTLLNDIRYQ